MGNVPRKADGRRVFSAEFKRGQVQRILAGEKTLAELSREPDIAPSVVRNWKRQSRRVGMTAVAANEDVVPACQLREAYARIRELERLLGPASSGFVLARPDYYCLYPISVFTCRRPASL